MNARAIKKVDIKVSDIMVESEAPYIKFYDLPTKKVILVDEGTPLNRDIKVLTYEISELINRFGETKFYAVQNIELLNDLMCLGQTKIQRIISDSYNKGLDVGNNEGFRNGQFLGFQLGEDYGRNKLEFKIKNLPWWKRLFNKF